MMNLMHAHASRSVAERERGRDVQTGDLFLPFTCAVDTLVCAMRDPGVMMTLMPSLPAQNRIASSSFESIAIARSPYREAKDDVFESLRAPFGGTSSVSPKRGREQK